MGIKPGEDLFLHLQILGRVLLDIIGIGQRGGEIAFNPEIGQNLIRGEPVEKIVGGKVGQKLPNETDGMVRAAGSTSQRVTVWPARAKVIAQARPINPAPMIETFAMVKAPPRCRPPRSTDPKY